MKTLVLPSPTENPEQPLMVNKCCGRLGKDTVQGRRSSIMSGKQKERMQRHSMMRNSSKNHRRGYFLRDGNSEKK
jgi:hypothetical protein